MNKKGQMVTMMISLMVATLIGVAVVLPSILGVINGASRSQIDTFSADLGTEETATYGDIVAGTDGLTCGAKTMGASDYNITSLTDGTFEVLEDRAFANYTLTSVFDTNVSVSKAGTTIGYIDSAPTVYNCSNASETWLEDTDYEVAYATGKVNVLSTGGMLNTTMYCGDFEGSVIADGTSCNFAYAYYTANDGSTTSAVVQLLPILFAIVLVVVIVGYIEFKG